MNLVHLPGNIAPAHVRGGFFRTGDGLALRQATSLLPSAARGSVIVLQGRGDFLERYFEVFGELNARGFSTASFDWRGQGGSPRLQKNRLASNVPDFALYDEDLESFIREVALPKLPRPWHVIAHSMGGCILLRALRKRNWFERAVLTSPMLDVNSGRWHPKTARRLAAVLNWLGYGDYLAPGRPRRPLGPKDFINNDLTTDERRYDRDQRTLAAAPQLGIGGPTVGWVHAAFMAMDELMAIPQDSLLTAPTLIVSAGDERVTRAEACRKFAARVANVSCVSIPGARHEILNERDAIRAEFWAAFDSFVGA